MAAQKVGIDVFLLTDCLLNKQNLSISQFNKGEFEKLYEIIEKM
jgi:hypothetical protein